MQSITLYIESCDGTKTVALTDEISIGRTGGAGIVLGDGGLSRLNTTFFLDEDLVFVVDENSTNGTYLNGERVSGSPRQIFDGDTIKIGSETRIRVEIGERETDRETRRQGDAAKINQVEQQISSSPRLPVAASHSSQIPNPPVHRR